MTRGSGRATPQTAGTPGKETRVWTNRHVEIAGHAGRPIHNRFYCHEPRSGELTVIIAGFGYTLESPYLFYSRHVPFTNGSDVLAIDLQYSALPEMLGASPEDQESWFQDDTRAIADFITTAPYPRYNFIGKSLGTTVIYRLLQEDEFRTKVSRVVWLTPGEMHTEIAALLAGGEVRSLAVYGEADRMAESADLETLRTAPNLDLMIVPGADHALETDDVTASVDYLAGYVRRLRDFWVTGTPG
jgi:pimeloyl-ACP methyl ester carboxylesterase